MQHALRGVCQPLLYCDIDPYCRDVLASLMKRGRLPRAPVLDDVRDISGIMRTIRESGKQVDMIISTSSCKGFSNIGAARGLQHPETKLMLISLELIRRIRPPLVFMENVPGMLNTNDGKDFALLLQAMRAFGYSARWGIYSAAQLGAHHVRKRWYAVFRHRTKPLPAHMPEVALGARFDWQPGAAPRKHLLDSASVPDAHKRLSALGNAVVPECARFAFVELLTGIRQPLPLPPCRPLKLQLNSSLAPQRRPRGSKPLTSPRVRKFTLPRFPTPRAGNTGACTVMTERCIRDLGTVLKFWKVSRGKRHGTVANPRFVEWLMGFPRDWTKRQE